MASSVATGADFPFFPPLLPATIRTHVAVVVVIDDGVCWLQFVLPAMVYVHWMTRYLSIIIRKKRYHIMVDAMRNTAMQ